MTFFSVDSYRPRLVDKIIRNELEAFGAVLITGPKWCGKTTTASRLSKSIIRMQDPDFRDAYRQVADTKPMRWCISRTEDGAQSR